MTDDVDFHEQILEGAGATDYERYLRTDELLSLQKRPEEQVHHDELLFQTVHQTSELWLKFATTEVEVAASHLEAGEVALAIRLLRRAVLSIQYVTAQLEMLNHMAPWDFLGLRVALGHGAGFDSPGFRRVPHVTQRAMSAFERVLQDAGVGLIDIYRRSQEFEDLFQLAELLTEWDERIWVWRFRHYSIVARSIGEGTIGTQGTPVQVLGKLISQRLLPKLWEVRTQLAAERPPSAPEAG
ncbi:MAG TPA: tryptophan 2,3-dioxygenase family protein [Solirubrobacteraceae bacterium]